MNTIGNDATAKSVVVETYVSTIYLEETARLAKEAIYASTTNTLDLVENALEYVSTET